MLGEHILMPNNVCISSMRLPYTNDRQKLKPVLTRAARRIGRFADRVREGRFFRRGFSAPAVFSGALQRVPFSRVYPRLRDCMGVEAGRCNGCRLCVELCPAGNLSFQGEKLETRGSCVLCLRCYCFCPQVAITFMNKPHNLKRGLPYRGPVEQFHPQILLGRR